MQLGTNVTDVGDMCLTVSYGPVTITVVFAVEDEDTVMKHIQQGFEEARRARGLPDVYAQ